MTLRRALGRMEEVVGDKVLTSTEDTGTNSVDEYGFCLRGGVRGKCGGLTLESDRAAWDGGSSWSFPSPGGVIELFWSLPLSESSSSSDEVCTDS